MKYFSDSNKQGIALFSFRSVNVPKQLRAGKKSKIQDPKSEIKELEIKSSQPARTAARHCTHRVAYAVDPFPCGRNQNYSEGGGEQGITAIEFR